MEGTVLRSFCRIRLSCVLLFLAAPALAQVPLTLPPSPISDGVHDRFDQLSGCWVWDGEAREAQVDANLFVTSQKCGGKALDGVVQLRWIAGTHRGETWKGVFRGGRLTGQVSGSAPPRPPPTPRSRSPR